MIYTRGKTDGSSPQCCIQGPIVQQMQQQQQQAFSHAQGLPMREMGAPAYRP